MPQIFSDESVEFLERFQYITRRKEGAVPTDSFSLLDICLHTNSVFVQLLITRLLPVTRETEARSVVNEELNTSANATISGMGGVQSVEDGRGRNPTNGIVHGTTTLVADDLDVFNTRLSEDVLAPVLFSFLDFYVDRRLERRAIRQGLCAYFESTPYLREAEPSDAGLSMYSTVAFLFLSLTRALLQCEFAKDTFAETMGYKRNCSLPTLPWLKSRSEYTIGEPTWYWHGTQRLQTIQKIVAQAEINEDVDETVQESGETRGRTSSDGYAINIVYDDFQTMETRKRKRDASNIPSGHSRVHYKSVGISTLQRSFSTLPYELQEYVLNYLHPADLPVARTVCKAWQALISHSARMQFYILAGRAVARIFFAYMKEKWGRAWVRVDKLTTAHRLFHQERQLKGYLSHLSHVLGRGAIASVMRSLLLKTDKYRIEWDMLRGIWSAIEMEVKQFPFVAHPAVSLMQCMQRDAGNLVPLFALIYEGMEREVIILQLARNCVLYDFIVLEGSELILGIIITQMMYFIKGERKIKHNRRDV
ncbi:hypothetical protein, conserved [Trypanosoma brucei gambiense DAL972]|uniref:F-box domain-containing protein n=1 Tax=Trypanosoma brucei gambiense (strain MHOM/CI/86/DAL972) TaxID=679716 RepID=C9ZT36_TRYB9|nr:hypothetical protein, conserved [Trypanosoma brucei gambiense DAL972]CBH12571.1 hypothetical protein, conserved [Trypanosoma brucei gambiense DAL972]|eukprot:XP_011774851.1 hypothetical protein, conserved [Trypanosoma brucei gambiense DAL972]